MQDFTRALNTVLHQTFERKILPGLLTQDLTRAFNIRFNQGFEHYISPGLHSQDFTMASNTRFYQRLCCVSTRPDATFSSSGFVYLCLFMYLYLLYLFLSKFKQDLCILSFSVFVLVLSSKLRWSMPPLTAVASQQELL